jgi:hypothetical protein
MDAENDIVSRPVLRSVQTDNLDHFTPVPVAEYLSLEEQTAVLQAMTSEAPPGAQPSAVYTGGEIDLVQTPTSISSDFDSQVPSVLSSPTSPLTPLSPTSSVALSQQRSKFASALDDVRHFAGGLISHPYESTKHYSILRHSLGIVYYSGSTTTLAITIFADREIPQNRMMWLQRRGFSGKTGLRIGGLLGVRSSWVDVTPSQQASPQQIHPFDERGYQRDIKKFLRKAPREIRAHRPRETAILRIPCDADDGYLRVVLCTGDGKKTLCGSPIFRLVSSSTDSSVLRGSSLKTLPLEAGIKLAAITGRQAVRVAAGPYVNTAREAVTSQITSVYQPSALLQTAATAAYDESGIAKRIDEMNGQYDATRDGSFNLNDLAIYDALSSSEVIGPDSGPEPPFPVRFHGKVIHGTGYSGSPMNVPTADLANVPEDILLRHKGVFFGWTSIHLPVKLSKVSSKSSEKTPLDNGSTKTDDMISIEQYFPSIVSISPDHTQRATVLPKNTAKVHLIHDIPTSFVGATLSILLLGILHPNPPLPPLGTSPDIQTLLATHQTDVRKTLTSLSRPAWTAQSVLQRMKEQRSQRSISERYVAVRQGTQNAIDKVPVHRLGVRTEGHALRDRFVGNGGIWVKRDVEDGLVHSATN